MLVLGVLVVTVIVLDATPATDCCSGVLTAAVPPSRETNVECSVATRESPEQETFDVAPGVRVAMLGHDGAGECGARRPAPDSHPAHRNVPGGLEAGMAE